MKVTIKMIKEYVDIKSNLKDLSDRIALSGTEESQIDYLHQFEVVEIVKINKHPNADRLNICIIKRENEETLQIVCGASNVYEGMKTILAPVGTRINKDIEIKKSQIRGQYSYGMLCSGEEIGIKELSNNGIIDIKANIGEKLYNILDDFYLEFKITPNRGDLMSANGIAREIHGLGLGEYKKESIDQIETSNGEDNIFIARINNINLDTPEHIKSKLDMIGVKLISGPVDIANYCMYMYGQPMHVYDADKIEGKLYIKRYSGKFLGLDNKEYILDDVLVVSDEKKIVSIAGILGSADTAVSINTKNILIESAYFNREDISKSLYKLNIITEASMRFSRGIDNDNILNSLYKCIKMISGELINISGNKNIVQKSLVCNSIDISNIERFGFVKKNNGEIVIPSWRNDINDCTDLNGEIIRVGMDEIKSKPLTTINSRAYISSNSKSTIHTILRSYGLNERITPSFINAGSGIKVSNYGSNLLLRESLVYGLLEDYSIHKSNKYEYAGVYEVGKVFISSDEEENISAIFKTDYITKYKELFDTILSYLNYNNKSLDTTSNIFDRDVQVNISRARFGKINKDLLLKYNIEDDLSGFEIPFVEHKKIRKYESYKFYPSVYKDITFISNGHIAGNIINKIYKEIEEIESIILKDTYNDRITIRITMRSRYSTINNWVEIMDKIFVIFKESNVVIPE